ncbi:MAG: glycosyltransferase [Chloroflexota bacterium]|nr:glycosyltransferase [Chloroflexota bacterium]
MLISMAVYSTESNGRAWMTVKTLDSLARTVDWERHRLVVIDNGSCKKVFEYYRRFEKIFPFYLIVSERNVGTARAVNKGWALREPGEHCVKMDDDVVFHQPEWADWIEDVFERDPQIGICGLKRNDLDESPFAEGSMQSTLRMLPHEKGQRWLVVEEVESVIGTCQGYSSALLDVIGYLTQPGVYGFDDSLSAVRAKVCGFKSAFLCGFEIDHIDPGGTPYTTWKRQVADTYFPDFRTKALLYESGVLLPKCDVEGRPTC